MNKIEYGTEFLDQLKDSVHDLYDENKELKKEINKLIAESTEWESKCYNLQERISYLERSNDRREDTILGLRQEINDKEERISKAIEIYENRNSIEYKKKRFMEDKTIAYFMYEELKGVDKE